MGTTTVTELLPQTWEVIDDYPEDVHLNCCLIDGLSLCGFPLIVEDEVLDDCEVTCIVCDDMDQNDTCPFLGVCPYDD